MTTDLKNNELCINWKVKAMLAAFIEFKWSEKAETADNKK